MWGKAWASCGMAWSGASLAELFRPKASSRVSLTGFAPRPAGRFVWTKMYTNDQKTTTHMFGDAALHLERRARASTKTSVPTSSCGIPDETLSPTKRRRSLLGQSDCGNGISGLVGNGTLYVSFLPKRWGACFCLRLGVFVHTDVSTTHVQD